MNLRIFAVLDVLKGVRSNPDTQPIDVYKDGKKIYFESPDSKITLVFTLDELRSIMRLFDVPEEK